MPDAIAKAIETLRENEGDDVADAYELVARGLAERDAKIGDLENRLNASARSAEEEAAAASQRAIDANPVLARWQAAAHAAGTGDATKSALDWEKAMALDEVLGASPEWAGRPLHERFDEVVRILGPGAPGSGAPSTPDPAAAAAAAPETPPADAPVPGLSSADLPTGSAPPADSPATALESMSPQDLERQILAQGHERWDALVMGNA